MFDISWNELLVIAAVALVVIGPKDLPKVLRALTQWIRKARELAADFQRNVDEMMREAELSDLKNQIEKATSGVVEDVKQSVDPGGEMQKAFEAPPDLTEPPSALSPPAPEFSAEAAASETLAPLASPSASVEVAPPTPSPAALEPAEPVGAPAPGPNPAIASEPAPPAKAAS
ncbi:MAG: twin-arginine translocase subunit TatB [Proteobacteria bacterium]|nr:twin-arginine translocase subunit TatB [Pseudomonadota bacterium]MBI3498897.1 twin-arginine translocase subunit TatB [Pseudomonadota bacterium]